MKQLENQEPEERTVSEDLKKENQGESRDGAIPYTESRDQRHTV